MGFIDPDENREFLEAMSTPEMQRKLEMIRLEFKLSVLNDEDREAKKIKKKRKKNKNK